MIEYLLPVAIVVLQSLLFAQFIRRRKVLASLFVNPSFRLSFYFIPVEVWNDPQERIKTWSNESERARFSVDWSSTPVPNALQVVQLRLVDRSSTELVELEEAVNQYLFSNQGMQPDYHLIKDMTDRVSSRIEAEMDELIPAPLYLGLIGAMVGVVSSIFYLDVQALEVNFAAINPMLNSLQHALFSSAIGIALTTISSIWLAKGARSNMSEGRYQWLKQIQIELLPAMSRADVTGIASLSEQLKKFNRNASSYVRRIEQGLSSGVSIIEKEENVLKLLEEIDVKAISSQNVKVLRQLSSTIESFAQIESFAHSFAGSLGRMDGLASSLNDFVQRTNEVSKTLLQIKKTSATQDEIASFFRTHLNQLNDYKNAYAQLVASTSAELKRYTEELKGFSKEQSDLQKESLAAMSSGLNKTFEEVANGVNEATQLGLEKLIKAYDSGLDLSKLDELNVVNQNLEAILKRVTNDLDSIKSQLKRLDKPGTSGPGAGRIKVKDVVTAVREFAKRLFRRKSGK